MTSHTLPILVAGRTTPVHVPCALPESFGFDAFLPSRGVRSFTCWLTTRDPLTAEVKDVTLNNREGDPRLPNGYELDEDEQRHADDAAGDVLGLVLNLLGVHPTRREAVGAHSLLSDIARAHDAECAAWEALRTAHASLHGRAPFYEANPASDELAGPKWASKAARMLEAYTERVVDNAAAHQHDKAEAQRDAWAPPSHPEDRNPPAWAERCEGC